MSLVASIHVTPGWTLPDVKLKNVAGEYVRLMDCVGQNGLLVAFTCNHCPYALAVWPRLIRHAATFGQQGINTIAINPNIRPDYPEDSIPAMKDKITEWKVNFPYLADETQQIAHTFDAQCTPDIYLFNKNRELYYHGRIDDAWKDEKKVTQQELVFAADAMLANQPAPQPQHPTIGCSIKWKDG